MFRHKPDGEALHGRKPRTRPIDRTVHILRTTVFAIGRKCHVLGKLASQTCAEQIESRQLHAQSEFVGITQPRRMSPIDAGIKSRMMASEIGPLRPENAHDTSAEQDMCFTLGTVHVALAPITPIVNDERNPKTRIEREPVQTIPCESDQNGMENELMSSEQQTFCTDFHNLKVLSS